MGVRGAESTGREALAVGSLVSAATGVEGAGGGGGAAPVPMDAGAGLAGGGAPGADADEAGRARVTADTAATPCRVGRWGGAG